jgi:hypothetical protein
MHVCALTVCKGELAVAQQLAVDVLLQVLILLATAVRTGAGTAARCVWARTAGAGSLSVRCVFGQGQQVPQMMGGSGMRKN